MGELVSSGLGNIYFTTNQYTRAKECFYKAIEINPSYFQAYYTLAQIAQASDDLDTAMKFMEEGRSYLESSKYVQGSGPDRQTFAEAFCDYYNFLSNETNSKRPPLYPPNSHLNSADIRMPKTKKEKIGRNAPCPCGSGKKYKKCCIDK